LTPANIGAVPATWLRKTANYTAVASEKIVADTSGGAFTITLPATPSTGDTVVIGDGADFSTNNLTVGRNGSTIEGVADDFGLDIQHVKVEFVYDGTTWQVFPTISAAVLPARQTETVGTISTNTLDLSTGNVFSHAPSSNITYVFSNPPASGIAYGFTFKVTPSGSLTITWPTSVDWAGGTAPDSPASGETDVYTFFTIDGGTTWYGFQAGDAMA
jgi:hypothetical protein